MKLSRILRRDPAAPTLKDRAADLAAGLARHKGSQEVDPARRAVMGGALAAVVPLPALAAPAATPSDLARACDAAVAHMTWINAASVREAWSDARLHHELNRFDDVLDHAADEPATCLGDIAAKARILVCDFDSAFSGFRPDELDPGERALLPFLREVGALTQAGPLPPAPLPAAAEIPVPYAEHRARLLAAYAEDKASRPISGGAEDKASRPISGGAEFGTVEFEAARLVQCRCLEIAREVAALPARDLDEMAVTALATAVIWEATPPSEPGEIATVALIRSVLALTGTPLPEGFVGFGDEADYGERDDAVYAAPGSLPAWAIAEASADTDNA